MPSYSVTNRATREAHTVEAPYAQDACDACGWLIGDCHVQKVRESPTDPDAYALARRIGDARYGSPCAHEHARGGRCRACGRVVR